MDGFYAPYIPSVDKENEIFSELDDSAIPREWSGGMDLLDPALDWLCAGASDVLDFGCGTGSLLAACGRAAFPGSCWGSTLRSRP